ncbi:hypothetical protein [Dyadobacter psychrotolerans]|uniref:Uncharacterized protein n=1 Tax=Dyadobacter psychrotolerans TaxID=2541721 RepID=A0A4R5DM85_9BACT|nr:hypothetical protein [Dyadobacter psychrotolerans]TDE15239.1 hypothetical protein E0F88_11995 [Dyadobacter psychrotolerans]
MRRFIILFLISLLVLTLLNLPKVSLGIMVMMEDTQYKKTNYHYSSGDDIKGFSVWSRKGFQDVQEQFEKYKERHPSDTLLYRNFTKQYWKVWRWRDYLWNEQYQLPFQEEPSDARQVSRGE